MPVVGGSLVSPTSVDEVVAVIRDAMSTRSTVRPIGSGSSFRGRRVEACDVALSTERLSGIVEHDPDDLTLVAGAGTTLDEIDRTLAGHRQTAILPEESGTRTIGGVVASGDSGYRRLRYGPTRDRVLGITLVTGYGERVAGGGRLVKNVTGYDLPRLITGSRGMLGVVTEVCLKLWPQPPVRRTISIPDAGSALRTAYRPSAVLETEVDTRAYVEGSEPTVATAEARLGGVAHDGHDWPDPLDDRFVLSVRVPPRHVVDAVDLIRSARSSRFIAQHGVGRIDAAWPDLDVARLDRIRSEVSELRGIVVVERWPDAERVDRWGVVPSAPHIERHLAHLFDPEGILCIDQIPGGR
jgi:glycolate oxidase FAD binding subunit